MPQLWSGRILLHNIYLSNGMCNKMINMRRATTQETSRTHFVPGCPFKSGTTGWVGCSQCFLNAHSKVRAPFVPSSSQPTWRTTTLPPLSSGNGAASRSRCFTSCAFGPSPAATPRCRWFFWPERRTTTASSPRKPTWPPCGRTAAFRWRREAAAALRSAASAPGTNSQTCSVFPRGACCLLMLTGLPWQQRAVWTDGSMIRASTHRQWCRRCVEVRSSHKFNPFTA